MTDDAIHSTQYYMKWGSMKWGYFGQVAVQNIETWQADSSTGNTPMATKNAVAVATHSFLVPTHLISIC